MHVQGQDPFDIYTDPLAITRLLSSNQHIDLDRVKALFKIKSYAKEHDVPMLARYTITVPHENFLQP
eukprot:12412541-Karenia_brevis.AAC.1